MNSERIRREVETSTRISLPDHINPLKYYSSRTAANQIWLPFAAVYYIRIQRCDDHPPLYAPTRNLSERLSCDFALKSENAKAVAATDCIRSSNYTNTRLV